MPGPSFINNPAGALSNAPVTTYLFGRDAAGFELEQGKGEVYTFRANATVTRGQALMWVVPTATVPLSVTPMTAGADLVLFAGVALESGVAGDNIPVMRRGICIAFTDDSDTPAFGQILLRPDATTGQFATAAVAATIQFALGTVLSAEMDGAGVRKSLVMVDPVVGSVNPAS